MKINRFILLLVILWCFVSCVNISPRNISFNSEEVKQKNGWLYGKDTSGVVTLSKYKNGKKHGKTYAFHSYQFLFVSKYKKDLLHGKTKHFQRGKKIAWIKYKKDERIKGHKVFNPPY